MCPLESESVKILGRRFLTIVAHPTALRLRMSASAGVTKAPPLANRAKDYRVERSFRAYAPRSRRVAVSVTNLGEHVNSHPPTTNHTMTRNHGVIPSRPGAYIDRIPSLPPNVVFEVHGVARIDPGSRSLRSVGF